MLDQVPIDFLKYTQGAVINDEVDVSLANWERNFDRSLRMDFTLIINTGTNNALINSANLASIGLLRRPFSEEAWTGIAVALGIIFVVIGLMGENLLHDI